MNEQLFSATWYRVASVRPHLRGHARIVRHVYRGRPAYVLHDLTSQRSHRLEPTAQAVIGLIDGQRTVQQIWELASERLGDEAPTQDELIQLLGQLHAADALQTDVPPDTLELLERYRKKTQRERIGRWLNPFAIRIPLLDPQAWLERCQPLVDAIVNPRGGLLWLAVVLPALGLVALHWPELSEGFLDRVLTPQNLLLVWLTFPVIKVLHELGHGFVARRFGAEIHDMGIMLLVFTPVPYVDASSASALPSKHQRALVGAGGMLAELFVAALAVYVWVAVEPGVMRAVAFNVMLIAGVTTLGFNANPLLRFDGYYVLADWIEIPNLRVRSNRFFQYLVERHAFRQREAEPPEANTTERAWLVGFGVASFFYRMFVMLAIMLYVLELSLVLGVILAVISLVGWFGVPLVKGIRFLLYDPKLREVRGRATAVAAGAVALGVALIAVVPAPFRTQSEGVVWIPESAIVRAETEGFVEAVRVQHGDRVAAGDTLFVLRAPELRAEITALEARLRGLAAHYLVEQRTSRARAAMVAEERDHVALRLARARERQRGLAIHAPSAGRVAVPFAIDLPGRFVRKGQVLAHLIETGPTIVRTVVSEDDIDLVRERTERVEIRLVERVGKVLPAQLQRVVPSASEQLPSSALGSAGGGEVAIDPRDERGTRAVEKLFEVDLEIAPGVAPARLGGRVYVQFDHGYAPISVQAYRGLRQLLLSRLSV